MASPAKKKKHSRSFQDQWLADPAFKDWLIKDESDSSAVRMKCSICCETKQKNIFTTGCTDFQRSSIVRHISSDGHRRALHIKSMKGSLKKSFQTAETKTTDSLTQQLRTVYFMVKNNISLSTFPQLIELQKANGCERLQCGHYTSSDVVTEMLHCISGSLEDSLKKNIQDSKFIGVLLDESCDIAVLKKLIIYVQTVVNGKACVNFAANIDVPDGKAQTIHEEVKNWMNSLGIPSSKVTGLATDGAAVMTGVRSGVGTRMKQENKRLVHIHCVAHKLALAVSQASASINAVKSFQETVEGIYFYFSKSAVRYNRLRSVYSLLEDDKFITLKQPHAVRWLSLHQAVQAIHSSWAALVITLGEEAVNNDRARGYLRAVNTSKFISITCLLMDILPLFTKLSKVLQRASLDFSSLQTGLETVQNTLTTFGNNSDELLTYTAFRQEVSDTGLYQGQPVTFTEADERQFISTKDTLLGTLLEKLEERFPSDTMHVLKSFDVIFSPKLYPDNQASIPAYGRDHIKFLLDHYQPLPEDGNVDGYDHLIDRDRCQGDFLQFKHHTKLHQHLGFADYVQHVITTLGEEYPDYKTLAELVLSVPLNSASCERGFSVQNICKTKARNRLGQDNLQDIMRISVNGPDFAQFDYTGAAGKFRALKDRRK